MIDSIDGERRQHSVQITDLVDGLIGVFVPALDRSTPGERELLLGLLESARDKAVAGMPLADALREAAAEAGIEV